MGSCLRCFQYHQYHYRLARQMSGEKRQLDHWCHPRRYLGSEDQFLQYRQRHYRWYLPEYRKVRRRRRLGQW